MKRTLRLLGLLLLACAGITGTFVLTTVSMDQMPDTVLIAVALVGAFVVVAASLGGHGFKTSERRWSPDVLTAAFAGVLAFWGAPLLALSQRATDSPSGSDTAMLTLAAWGAITLVVAYLSSRGRMPSSVPAGGLAALFGAAAILANWERPSSLNLFVKAADREIVMVLAGVVFAIGAVLLSLAVKRIGAARASAVSTASAVAIGVIFALPSIPSALPVLAQQAFPLMLLGLSYGAFCWGWIRATALRGAGAAGVSLLLAPAMLTTLSIVERAVGVFGPNPLVWAGVSAGVALTVTGAATVLLAGELRDSLSPMTRLHRAALGIAMAAAASALTSLFLPAIRATSEGSLGEGFKASWLMLGFETAAGWMPVVASCLALAALYDLGKGGVRSGVIMASVTSWIAVFTVVPLRTVPLHTWTSWIPPDVQQTYGTEYARFFTESIISPMAVLSLALAGTASVFAFVLALKQTRENVPKDNDSEGH